MSVRNFSRLVKTNFRTPSVGVEHSRRLAAAFALPLVPDRARTDATPHAKNDFMRGRIGLVVFVGGSPHVDGNVDREEDREPTEHEFVRVFVSRVRREMNGAVDGFFCQRALVEERVKIARESVERCAFFLHGKRDDRVAVVLGVRSRLFSGRYPSRVFEGEHLLRFIQKMVPVQLHHVRRFLRL